MKMEVRDEFLQEEPPGRDGSLICRACLRPHPGAEHSRSRHLRRLFVFLRRQRLYSRNERRRGHASEIAGGFNGTNSFVFGAGGAPILGSTVPENSRCVRNWIISVSARTAARRITFASRLLPHTEVSVKPPDVGKDIPPIDGRRLANSATLKLIP